MPRQPFIDLGKRLLVVALMMFVNVFICFSVAGVVLLELLSITNIEKHVCLIIAILTAIGVQLFIVYHHKLRNYINNGAGSNE
jgi:hypothetical protein